MQNRNTEAVMNLISTWPTNMPDINQSDLGRELCSLGCHAFVPWLTCPNGSVMTWCVRDGCDYNAGYDF